ncbi:MAG: bifunctional phosphopantothenoylcysteine decarboxylase/phosphopantothenate--cysteine ligase CoaBC [Hyphomicrobiaceae bacterium]|nr:bifunctional phosphopantothenoylcysteine decarboxylase/phosphopantothenate--cysteine ligase CoaBC [Hyphomicrobiaceae bacterium]
MREPRILLIIGGGIAAYKCLDLVRRLRERGITVRAVMTKAAHQFVTPLAVSALTNERVFTDLFDLDDEREIGHIRLTRQADLVLVAPATADLIAKMANGHADDLASATLIASSAPIVVAPAMNPRMWRAPATQRNVARLNADGITVIPPAVGEMAEAGEAGQGRLPEVADLVAAVERHLAVARHINTHARHLEGLHVLVTSGPTLEAIDPVRYIANRSSGKQGHAIAAAAAAAGARVTLVAGPVALADPPGVTTVHVESARDMLAAVEASLPADIAIFCAAVADWRVEVTAGHKIKKAKGAKPPTLALVENPDILKTIARRNVGRPAVVIGFAAETTQVIAHAQAKLAAKGCDLIIANDVAVTGEVAGGVMGGDRNRLHFVSADGVESLAEQTKEAAAADVIRRAHALFTAKQHVQRVVTGARGTAPSSRRKPTRRARPADA